MYFNKKIVRSAYQSDPVQDYLRHLKGQEGKEVKPASLLPDSQVWGHHIVTQEKHGQFSGTIGYQIPGFDLFLDFQNVHYLRPKSLSGNFKDILHIVQLSRKDMKLNPKMPLYMPILDLARIHFDASYTRQQFEAAGIKQTENGGLEFNKRQT